MALITMSVKLINTVEHIVFEESEDRNGPVLEIVLADKQDFRAAINQLNNVGDSDSSTGSFGHRDDTTNLPIAIFSDESDADSFLASKGAGHRKDQEPGSIDGYDFKIVREQ